VVTCQFEKITKGQNQLPWVYQTEGRISSNLLKCKQSSRKTCSVCR